jgi:hypothetical protein
MIGPVSWASEQVDRYADLEPLYDAFSERLHDLLEQLVEDDEIYLRHSYAWARTSSDYETALYRALRERRRLGDRLEEVGDVAGVALVVTTPAEVDAVAAIVERELAVDYSHSLPPAAARAANERNFSSETPVPRYEHATYVVALDDPRRQLREWSAYADLQLEVHVLTYSQYTWWTTETRYLPYYWPSSFPPASREAFVRVASLLAAADEALASEEAARESIDERYADAIAARELDIPLDARALAVYLTHFDTLDELTARAVAEGMRQDEPPDRAPYAWQLEQVLLWLLDRFGIGTLAELHTFVDDAAPRAPEVFQRLTELATERGYVPLADSGSVLAFLLLVLNRADAETVELTEYRDEIATALNILIGNPVADEGE